MQDVDQSSILQEPSPMTFAAAHLAMKGSFDMDELYRHLVTTEGNKGKTRVRISFPPAVFPQLTTSAVHVPGI